MQKKQQKKLTKLCSLSLKVTELQMLRHKQPKACVLYSGMLLLWFPLEPWLKIYRSHPRLAIFQNVLYGKSKLRSTLYKLHFQVHVEKELKKKKKVMHTEEKL